MYIKINSEDLQYNITFNRRLNLIVGDSGTGKTLLYNLVSDFLNQNDSEVKLSSSFPIVISNLSRWKQDLEQMKNSIILFDDINVIELASFSTMYKKYAVENNLWIIAMSREDDLASKSKQLSYSPDAVYQLINKKDMVLNVPFYKIPSCNIKPDYIVVEDSSAGFEFFNYLFSDSSINVVTSKGKSNIEKTVLNLLNKNEKAFILVFVDLAAFGCHMYEFYHKILQFYSNVYVVPCYECFEYLLLRTNMLRTETAVINSFNNIEHDANQYYSWEKYFESLLKYVTENKMYKQTHKMKLSECYYKNCIDCNSYRKVKCDKSIDGYKFYNLLINTEFAFLLSYK